MTEESFNSICINAIEKLRQLAPKDTGNLAYNAIRFDWLDGNTFKIFVDENIAPYMLFTNEPWTSERWKGKSNPNEGWFDQAVKFIVNFIVSETKGELLIK